MINLPENEISEFCRRWKIQELALFGSALNKDFRPESDVDLLVTFEDDAAITLFDMVRMQDELKAMLGREVDLVSRRGIESSNNYLRRNAILNSARVVYGS